MIGGYIASAILAASGLAGVLMPRRLGPVLDTDLSPSRARAEFRIAYGCFAVLGIWALFAGSAVVFTAIGALWLGAAGVRLLALALDRPRADWTYWAFLVLEVALGLAGVVGNR